MRIRVVPEQLREGARALNQAEADLEALHAQIQRAWASLDWEVRQEAALEAGLTQARRMLLALLEETAALRRFLESTAAAFEQADQEGASRLSSVSGRFLPALSGAAAALPPTMRFPTARLERLLTLGGAPPGSASPLRLEPAEERALFDAFSELALEKAGLGWLNDLLDTARMPAWLQGTESAFRAWEQAVLRWGGHSPQAQQAYGRYLEQMVFQMPFLGRKAEALISILNMLGRAHPVE
jgi:hypothetical protein